MLIHIGFAFPAEIEIGCIFTTVARTYTCFRKVLVTPQVYVAVSWQQRCTQSLNFRQR